MDYTREQHGLSERIQSLDVLRGFSFRNPSSQYDYFRFTV